ncbi:uncharacterized protein [Spinacia oleracea]|uniref:Uncharacterized protein n=1 Tax=Spinacia oleracea TaxID=3562 RepID=A0A9R0IL71_SPIOL|nr:uncharacterized protein LOC110790941 [Spinacia oleracea]
MSIHFIGPGNHNGSSTTLQVAGCKGPIFEDGPNFDLAFNLFHVKDGVVPLSRKSRFHADDHLDPRSAQVFNPLAAKVATISLSAFGLGGPFAFNFFSDKWKKEKQKSESSGEKHNFAQDGRRIKKYRGMGYLEAMTKGSDQRYLGDI